ncbi:MAG: YkgJ family cysteine cluster protein [Betaproteobacteria bacterium]
MLSMDVRPTTNTANDSDGGLVACSNCEACCCRLEVILMAGDDVPARFSMEDQWGGSVMRRLGDGWCAALDRDTFRCTIYARRPALCRDFEVGASGCLTERRQLVTGKSRSTTVSAVIPIVGA